MPALRTSRRVGFRPGRDRRAQRHAAPAGAPRAEAGTRVVVVGGGIAGLAAATALAERGVAVRLLEPHPQLGGRVRAWPVDGAGDRGGRTMSRGFHAFFRQYYNLRALLRRADPGLRRLVPLPDYPLVGADGVADSFARIPRTPPFNLAGFVLSSPSFPVRALARVDLPAALELITTRFPDTHPRYDGQSAADFLDRLRFPDSARHLALEVFSRSFFADPREFSAGEVIAMFHTYFTGSAEGLLFDVPDDDYDTALWRPLSEYLTRHGAEITTGMGAEQIRLTDDGVTVITDAGDPVTADAVVLAADPRTSRALVAGLDDARADPDAGWDDWRARVAAERNAPRFVVWRVWLDRLVEARRPGFLGTTGFDGLDNISALERFEAGAADWSRRRGGSVVELHAYAADGVADPVLRARLWAGLEQVYPELSGAGVVEQEWLDHDDCALIGTGVWADRPGVVTPEPRLVLAGDWLRTDEPVALMERAATTGFAAANRLLAGWGVAGHDLWTVPMTGLLGRLPGSRRTQLHG